MYAVQHTAKISLWKILIAWNVEKWTIQISADKWRIFLRFHPGQGVSLLLLSSSPLYTLSAGNLDRKIFNWKHLVFFFFHICKSKLIYITLTQNVLKIKCNFCPIKFYISFLLLQIWNIVCGIFEGWWMKSCRKLNIELFLDNWNWSIFNASKSILITKKYVLSSE